MIKNFPTNKVKKYKILILELFFSSTAFLLRLTLYGKSRDFTRGLIDYLILTVKQLCAVPDAYKPASVFAVVPVCVHDLKLK